MHIRDNYNLQWYPTSGGPGGLGVFNGDIGEILEIDAASETVLVLYDDRIVYYPFDLLSELEPAYAMTVHKAQGSEYPAVVLVASSAASNRLLNRQVFYTAITRARRLLVIVGEEQVVSAMVANNRRGVRYSGLRSRLTET
jgi:exodeoxyribonuclease V alpha subunit